MPINDKVRCTECDWIGRQHEVKTAPNPFMPSDILEGCPECLCIGTIVRACHFEGCIDPVVGGRPTKRGYEFYCHEHRPEGE